MNKLNKIIKLNINLIKKKLNIKWILNLLVKTIWFVY